MRDWDIVFDVKCLTQNPAMCRKSVTALIYFFMRIRSLAGSYG